MNKNQKLATDSLLDNIVAISKAGAYNIIAPQVQELKDQVANLEQRNKQLSTALNYLLSSYRADFENITGAKLNDTEAVKKAKAAIEANNI